MSQSPPKKSLVGPTLIVLAITAIFSTLQFPFPTVLTTFRRVPNEISNHEYWRLFTALLVHNQGWKQIAVNFTAIAIIGTLIERIFGTVRWLVLYYVAGLIGEIAGLYWKPLGAGASVAGAGLLGALAFWMVKSPLLRPKFGGAFIILGACVLIYLHDLHGPPLLAGALMGAMMLSQMKPATLTTQQEQN